MSQKGSSSSSGVFDFENVLEITNDRNKKTGQQFKEQLFDFQDFRNIGDDRTQKSDNKTSQKWTNSDLMKKSFDSNLLPSQNLTQNDGQSRKQMSVYNPSGTNQFRSPKFMQYSDRQQSKTHNQFTLKPSKIKQSSPSEKKVQYYNPSSQAHTTSIQKPQKIKEIQQYQSLCDQINFFDQATQNLVFQGRRIRQNTEQLASKLAIHLQNSQFQRYSSQITQLNQQIQREKSIEKRLGSVCEELEDQYENVLKSVAAMNFARPRILNAETRAILQQIDALKAQFQALHRDEASLNFSATMQGLNSQMQTNKLSSKFTHPNMGSGIIPNARKDLSIDYDTIINQIKQEDRNSEDPKFLYNLKMSCLKDEWVMFNNSVLRVHVNYRVHGNIKVTIGNKNTLDLTKFSLVQEDTSIAEGQILSAKSYYEHKISTKKYENKRPFIVLKIKYLINFNNKNSNNSNIQKGQIQQIKIFIPNVILKSGQFIPFTKRELENEMSYELPQINGSFRPIDRSIISNLSQMQIFLPNLLFERNGSNSAYGIFQGNDNNGALIHVKQKDDLIKFWIKNGDIAFLKILQFIFTV